MDSTKTFFDKPNVLIILADQLRARSLPNYGFSEVEMPGFYRFGTESLTCDNAISTFPLCTPYRSMLFTGRHPQTTGVFVNYTCTRHDEIGMADAFRNAGYDTGFIGKWHLHRGAFPSKEQCWVPEGRSRLGFDYWRAYVCHTEYFNGHISTEDWNTEAWDGYETEGLLKYLYEFVEKPRKVPFFGVLSVHQPHQTGRKPAPDKFYEKLGKTLSLPDNVPDEVKEIVRMEYRDYLAETLAVDEMISQILDYLDQTGLSDKTLVVFSSDHGTQIGAHVMPDTDGGYVWSKRRAYEESIHVPLFVRFPNKARAQERCDALIAPVDLFPTLCSFAGVSIPRTVEGCDMSAALLGVSPELRQKALYIMNMSNFDYSPDWIRESGNEWRGVRTERYTYVKWRDGKTELYDLTKDILQQTNVVEKEEYRLIAEELKQQLADFMALRGDAIHPYEYYRDWIDSERRIVKNAFGHLPHPESTPDWSLLHYIHPTNDSTLEIRGDNSTI